MIIVASSFSKSSAFFAMFSVTRRRIADIVRQIPPVLEGLFIKLRFRYAPINVKPLRGGGGGIGGGFDVTSLPVVGTFDHSLSSFDQQ